MSYQSKIPAVDRRLFDQAKQLAGEFDQEVPSEVRRIEAHFCASDSWYLLGRNEDAYDCEQAALVRNCLGVGIPLSRELKSFLGVFTDKTGHARRFVVHHRANTELDLEKVAALLGAVSGVERLNLLGSNDEFGYGLINPFTIEFQSLSGIPHLQLFDNGIFRSDELPDTLMTNAGERTWSVEFRAEDLDRLISPENFLRGDVVSGRSHFVRPKIGILTGNSPESGALLWSALVKSVRSRRKQLEIEQFKARNPTSDRKKYLEPTGDVFMPEVHVRSVPAMGLTMDLHLRRDQIWKKIGPAIEAMCGELSSEEGEPKKILAIACNTTPHFSAEILEISHRHNVRYVPISEAVEHRLVELGIKSAALLGIGYIHNPHFSGYENLYRKNGPLELHELEPSTLKKVEDLAFSVKEEKHPKPRLINKAGNPKSPPELRTDFENYIRNELINILNRPDLKHENIIIALTELSLVIEWTNLDLLGERKKSRAHGIERQVFDAVQIYADLLADLFLGIRRSSDFSKNET